MAKRKRQNLDRVQINLYPGDLERLQALHTPPGAGPIIREMVRTYLHGIDLQVEDEMKRREKVDG
jgi:hypothetical protein